MSRSLLGSISVHSDATNQGAIKSRGKEFKVNTLHLFSDFKQAYNRTQRIELYVAMKELGFETKLIWLAKGAKRLIRNIFCERGTKARRRLIVPPVKPDSRDRHKACRYLNNQNFGWWACSGSGLCKRPGTRWLFTCSSGWHFHQAPPRSYPNGLVYQRIKARYMKTYANMVPDQIDNIGNIAGFEFEVVDEFINLEVLMRIDGNSTSEFKRRIMATSRCCYGLLHAKSIQYQCRPNVANFTLHWNDIGTVFIYCVRHLRSKLLTKQTNFKNFNAHPTSPGLKRSATRASSQSSNAKWCTLCLVLCDRATGGDASTNLSFKRTAENPTS